MALHENSIKNNRIRDGNSYGVYTDFTAFTQILTVQSQGGGFDNNSLAYSKVFVKQ